MPRLRILHVSPYYQDAWAYGGIPRVVPLLAKGLAERGHRVTVCTTDACDRSSRLPRAGGGRSPRPEVDLRVFSNLSNRAAYHLQLFLPLRFGAYLRRHAATFDVAHLHACRNLPGALAARHLCRAGVPYILAPHGTAPRIERRFLAKRLFDLTVGRQHLPAATLVQAVSEAERRQLVDLRVDPRRIRIVANPLELSEFDELPERGRFRARFGLGDEPVILYLGRLSPRKRLDVLASAFAKLEQGDLRLVIAGNDMGVQRGLQRLVRRLGLRGRVLFTGLLQGGARLEALRDADLLVYPAQHEIFGLVPLEALLCGTPVVVADDSGCAEIVRRTGGGEVVTTGDSGALARTMAHMLAAPEVCRADAAKAALRIRKLFDTSGICAELEGLYLEMATGGDRAR